MSRLPSANSPPRFSCSLILEDLAFWVLFRGRILEAADELTPMGKLLVLVDHAPRCRCGGNCETLQYLAKELIEAQSQGRPLLLPNRPARADLESESEAGTLVSWFPKD